MLSCLRENSLIASVSEVTLITRVIMELIVDQEEKDRLERGAEEELNRQCGDGTVQQVEVLQYGDEPEIEPGQAMVRVILTRRMKIRMRRFTRSRRHITPLSRTCARRSPGRCPSSSACNSRFRRSLGSASIPSSRCLSARRIARPRAATSRR